MIIVVIVAILSLVVVGIEVDRRYGPVARTPAGCGPPGGAVRLDDDARAGDVGQKGRGRIERRIDGGPAAEPVVPDQRVPAIDRECRIVERVYTRRLPNIDGGGAPARVPAARIAASAVRVTSVLRMPSSGRSRLRCRARPASTSVVRRE